MAGSRYFSRAWWLSGLLLPWLLAGSANADGDAQPAARRLWANSHAVWIYAKPRLTPNGVGYLRAGTSVALKSNEPIRGPGCGGGWYAVEPAGYICNDRRVLLAPNRYVSAMQLVRPGAGPLPYHYALSNHAPMYRRLPSEDEWQQHERYLGAPGSFGKLSWGNRGHEKLAERRSIEARDPLPRFFEGDGSVSRRHAKGALRRMIPLGSMLAYTKSFESAGRTWLFSADGTLVPADRVRPFRESSFRGVPLSDTLKPPLFWVKSQPEPKFVRGESGGFETLKQSWPRQSHVLLESGAPVAFQGEAYFETKERDAQGRKLFALDKRVSLVEPLAKLPWGIASDQKWISISITRGVLVAYRGLAPVFTTLVSPGAGGVPVKGHDLVKWSTTPIGRFRVTFKHLAADMSPEKGEERQFWIADVPYTQYFSPPFAIHVAYWHEDFGDPMSAGCVNVSPRDGQWLFGWTDPVLPKDWNGVAPSAFSGQGTVIIITR